jgi:chitin disaccharide deacetylase
MDLRRNCEQNLCMRYTVFLVAALLAWQPPSGPIRLIVKADDMGAGHGINVATIDAHKRGIVTTTNVIVPGPWFPEAVRLLKENPGLDVGVHLAVTSEWDNVKWRPLTAVPSLVDADGYFFPLVQPRPGVPTGRSIKENAWKLDDIERELRAQLDAAKRHLPQATYTWNHMGFPSVSPDVAALVSRLSKEYGLLVPADAGIQSVGRVYDSRDSGPVKADKLAARLETLGPGLWLHIDHASTDDPEMRAFGHAGYEWVAADRSANVEAWTSSKVREVITRRGIVLTSYRDLVTPARK